jgi:hypothetical protein
LSIIFKVFIAGYREGDPEGVGLQISFLSHAIQPSPGRTAGQVLSLFIEDGDHGLKN